VSDSTDEQLVLLEVADHIGIVTFNRPEALNASTTPFFRRLIRMFDEINDNPDIWCVVVRGEGRAFSVGADQKERAGMSLQDLRNRRRISPQAFSAMRTCIRPVIGQVHGYAIGGGLELALGCDIVIASEGTVMGLIETRLASIPAGGGTQILPRLVGVPRAKELIFTGRTFTAEEALTWGMISHVVPIEELETSVMSLAREIASAAPIANSQAKRAINMSMDVGVANGFDIEAALYERVLSTSDRSEGAAAHREKRPPAFTGE
jgi:enoyl-CoA hydratase/carnithine racemase